MNKDKIIQKIYIIVFISILVIFPIITLLDKDEEISIKENRKLSQTPKIDLLSILNGKFFNAFETYFSDQFYGRSDFMNMYSSIQLNLLDKKKIKDVVIGKDNYLLPYKDYVKNDNVTNNIQNKVVNTLKYLNGVVDSYNGELYYLFIPHKSAMYDDKYPQFYENGHEMYINSKEKKMDMIENAGINIVDTSSVLEKAKEKNDYIYFKTDHHHTFKGAYYSYQALLKSINENHPDWKLEYPNWDSMEKVVVDKKFIGSYLKKTGNLENNYGDYYEYAFPLDFPYFERYEYGNKVKSTLFRESEYANGIVDHEYLLGNRPNTVIKTNREWLPNILYIGYSYTNNLEAMSIYNFNEMHSIDPRYWKGNISTYIKQHKPDIVVVVRDDLYEGNKENVAKIR